MSSTAINQQGGASVQTLWEQGQKDSAIQQLVKVINRAPKLPRQPCLQLAYYLYQLSQFSSAEKVLSLYLKQTPADSKALENRGVLRMRLKQFHGAYEDLQKAVSLQPESVNSWDALTSALAQLKRYEEAHHAGSTVLSLKDRQCNSLQEVKVHWPNIEPLEWDQRHAHRVDVISFSLWGTQSIYLRGAIRNLLLAPKLYPGWVCRFYIDSSVPVEFSNLVTQLGGQIIIEKPHQSLRNKLSWRFQVADDPGVRRFLVRDADSLISEREVNAVNAWLESDRWFHVMRDWWTHTELILAGMWGGRAGLLEPLMPKMQTYRSGRFETPTIDQWFLRDCVWRAIRQSCLIHDRYFDALGSMPWPDPTPNGNYHVGQAVRPNLKTEMLEKFLDRYAWL